MQLSSSSEILFDTDVFESPVVDVDILGRVYCQEIERVMDELETLLPLHRSRVGEVTYAHAQDNLAVLKSCYFHNALTAHALDVLLQHLLMLAQLFLHAPDNAAPQETREEPASYARTS